MWHRFFVVNGAPMQQVVAVPNETLPLIDRRHELTAQEIERWAGRMEAVAVNLSRGPTAGAALVLVSDTKHLLMMGFHHLCFDVWSMQLFARHLRDAYESAAAGGSNGLPEPAIQLTDLALWQQGEPYRKLVEQQLSYWRRTLEGLDEAPRLLAEQFRNPQTGGGARRYVIPQDIVRGLRDLGSQSGASLFAIVLTCFKMLFHQYTNATDVCIEVLVANRSRPETRRLIAPCANAALLRTDLSGNPTFRELLHRVSTTVLDALVNVDVSVKIVHSALLDEGRIPQVCSRVQVDWQTLGQQTLRFGEAVLGEPPAPAKEGLVKTATGGPMPAVLPESMDLLLHFQETRDELRLLIIHRPDHITADDLDRLVDRYREILRRAVTSPDRPAT